MKRLSLIFVIILLAVGIANVQITTPQPNTTPLPTAVEYYYGIVTPQQYDPLAGTAGHDCTAAMTKAHATGSVVFYPAGTYQFSTFSFSQGGSVGAGKGRTILLSSDATTANLITYTGNSTPIFRDFTLQASNSKTAGAGLYFAPTSGTCLHHDITNIQTINIPVGIQFISGSLWNIERCSFETYSTAGVIVDDQYNTDAGDSTITGNEFLPNNSTGIAVIQRGAGGLRVINNKMVYGADGFVLQYTSGSGTTSTGDLIIANNSIEAMSYWAIYLGRNAGTGNFGAVQILGNQIAGCAGTSVIGTDTSGFLNQLIIADNNIAIPSGTGIGIYLNNVSNFLIPPNIIIGGGGTPTGIQIISTCSAGLIAPQNYISMNTNIINGSTGVKVEQAAQASGAQALTTGSASVTVPSGCKPLCADITAADAVYCPVSGTTMTLTGNGSDTISWVCF